MLSSVFSKPDDKLHHCFHYKCFIPGAYTFPLFKRGLSCWKRTDVQGTFCFLHTLFSQKLLWYSRYRPRVTRAEMCLHSSSLPYKVSQNTQHRDTGLCALHRSPPSGPLGTTTAWQQNSCCHPLSYSGQELLPSQDANDQLSSGYSGAQIHMKKKHYRNVNQF